MITKVIVAVRNMIMPRLMDIQRERCVYIYIYIYTCTCIYIYIYIYTHIKEGFGCGFYNETTLEWSSEGMWEHDAGDGALLYNDK